MILTMSAISWKICTHVCSRTNLLCRKSCMVSRLFAIVDHVPLSTKCERITSGSLPQLASQANVVCGLVRLCVVWSITSGSLPQLASQANVVCGLVRLCVVWSITSGSLPQLASQANVVCGLVRLCVVWSITSGSLPQLASQANVVCGLVRFRTRRT